MAEVRRHDVRNPVCSCDAQTDHTSIPGTRSIGTQTDMHPSTPDAHRYRASVIKAAFMWPASVQRWIADRLSY